MDKIEGATAFVTGGGGGIGLGIAQALAERGARIAVADIRDDHLAQARELAAREGWAGRALFLKLDIADRPGFAEALSETERRLGPLRILVNNAGVAVAGPIAEATHADWDWGVSVNLLGAANGVVAGLPLILRHGLGGHVVNTASLGALMPARPTRGIYAATKAAVIAMSEHLRLDLAGSGVGVSILLPGPTRTNIEESGKLRPEHLRAGSRFAELEAQKAAAAPPTMPNLPWLDPLDVGRMTVEGILADRPYIVTHPQYLDAIKARNGGIERAAQDPKETPLG